ncbi:MAG: hypothetical protein ABSC42_05935 [Tepidisphaeraceae bacterium]|jgi:hypothetical protein
MRNPYTLFFAAALWLFIGSRFLQAQTDKPSGEVKLELQVDALSTLHDLNLTPEQLSALKDLASDTAGTLSDTPAPVTADYNAAMKDMRDALLSKDEDRIDSAEDKIGDAADKQDPDSEPDVEQSESAKTKAVTFLKTLSVKQVAGYIGQNAEDIDDPTELLLDAVHQSRDLSDDDFASLRDDTSKELGMLSGGVNPGKPPKIVSKVNQLLTRVHRLSAEEYGDQQSALEDEARKLVAGMDPIPCLRHWMENEMADLLSNPELGQAIDDWVAAGKK